MKTVTLYQAVQTRYTKIEKELYCLMKADSEMVVWISVHNLIFRHKFWMFSEYKTLDIWKCFDSKSIKNMWQEFGKIQTEILTWKDRNSIRLDILRLRWSWSWLQSFKTGRDVRVEKNPWSVLKNKLMTISSKQVFIQTHRTIVLIEFRCEHITCQIKKMIQAMEKHHHR